MRIFDLTDHDITHLTLWREGNPQVIGGLWKQVDWDRVVMRADGTKWTIGKWTEWISGAVVFIGGKECPDDSRAMLPKDSFSIVSSENVRVWDACGFIICREIDSLSVVGSKVWGRVAEIHVVAIDITAREKLWFWRRFLVLNPFNALVMCGSNKQARVLARALGFVEIGVSVDYRPVLAWNPQPKLPPMGTAPLFW